MANKYDEIMAQFEGVQHLSSATEAQLDDVEERLGHKLPSDYREFLRGYSGYTFYSDVIYPVQTDVYTAEKTIFVFYDASSRETDIAERYRLALESDTTISIYTGMREVNGRTFAPDEKEYGWPAELMSIGCDEGGN